MQDISLKGYVKKRRCSGLRRGFLTGIIGEIDKSRCISYFFIVPKYNKCLFTGIEKRNQNEQF